MVKAAFLVVFQNDGSLELRDVDKSMLPMDADSIFGYHIHSKKALVGLYMMRNEQLRDFPSSAQMKQIRDAVRAKLQIDEL